jgi:uncharacterized protein YhjY with autotransporter beta-barrel domain
MTDHGQRASRAVRAGTSSRDFQASASRLVLVALLGAGGAMLAKPAFAQSGPIFWDRRGAHGGCCHSNNGHDGAPATDNFVLTQSGLNIATHASPGWVTGIAVDVSGGDGGDGADIGSQNHWGGNGGFGRIIIYNVLNSRIDAQGWGISALSKGGDGGRWGNGTSWGNGGDGHDSNLTVSNTTITAYGLGITADSRGGGGRDSAIPTEPGITNERDAGHGGNAGAARVTFSGNSSITVRSGAVGGFPDDFAAGIRAQSIGGDGGIGINDSEWGGHTNAGRGGTASDATVTAENGTITTTGDNAFGILARSVGGDARSNGNAVNVAAANGGDAGHVTVSNGARITTSGALSAGISARSAGGNGSDGGEGSWGGGHNGGAGGTPHGVTVTNSGSILTSGLGAHGITAAVIGGRGGNGGPSGASGRGGNGGAGAGTGQLAIDITNSGAITTHGKDAQGILAHAVGGGGGAAAASNGEMFIGGGSGGAGGHGGNFHLGNTGTIATSGDQSTGVLLQSIGGGGGHGGDANATGVIFSVATGGRGGAAGSAGDIVMTSSGGVSTQGAGASAIVLQSIGGGGGNGGSATASGVGIGLGIAVSHGGNGGGGGDGGIVDLTLDRGSRVTTAGALSSGVVAQGIGGGGGNGGFASSALITIAPNLGPEIPSGTLSPTVTIGGKGGGGGQGGILDLGNGGLVSTQGDKSYGILAQSIGGGGGNGGSAAAPLRAATVDSLNSKFNISIGTTIGGSGGSAGHGRHVGVTNQASGTIETTGDHAIGVLAQSVGGGGGSGGSVQQETAQSFGSTLGAPGATAGLLKQLGDWLEKAPSKMEFGSVSVGVDVRVGGNGAGGGNGGDVAVTNSGSIATQGAGAASIVAQSIGGGGGHGGSASSTSVSSLMSSLDSMIATMEGKASSYFSISPSLGTNVAVGGSGGAGGDGGPVTVANSGMITTQGFAAPGIFAQSVGGGGGAGTVTAQDLELFIKTHAHETAPEIISQITRIIDLLGSNLASAQHNVNVSVGKKGGADGTAGLVTIDASAPASRVATWGDSSSGIIAQSIAGGGGHASASSYTLGPSGFVSRDNGATPALSMQLGSTLSYNDFTARPAATPGGVVVTHGGAIETHGADSIGILAQSITGGGGVAAVNLASSAATIAVAGHQPAASSISLGSTLTASSITGFQPVTMMGAAVTVSHDGRIQTSGALSHGIMAQSVAGGGGVAALVVSPQVAGLLAGPRISLGATQAQGGQRVKADGGAVAVNLGWSGQPASVTTSGALAYGVLAQSVGGGGGYVALTSGNGALSLPGMTLALGATGQAAGRGGTVGVMMGANAAITTSGQNAHGVVAQSVGGGGGIAGLTIAPGLSSLVATQAVNLFDGANDGGAVNVTAHGRISTSGKGAAGVLAQSVGGGGGIAGDTSAAVYGIDMVKRAGVGGSVGTGGAVTVDVGGTIRTTGANAPGILAMSLGGGAVFKDGGVLVKDPPSWQGNSGGAVNVTIRSGGSVSALGAGSPAIVAISMGNAGPTGSYNYGGSPITVTIEKGASATANLESGVGVLAISTAATTLANAGTISAKTAIQSQNTAIVANSGIVHGDLKLGGASTFSNNAGGELWSGANLTLQTLDNTGTISPGGPGVFQGTRLTGALHQSGTGTLAVDLDFAGHNSDFLSVSGAVSFGGAIVPILHNPVKDIWLGIGHFDQIPAANVVPVIRSSALLFSFDLKDHYGGSRDPLISVNANFRPQGGSLNSDQSGIADHLQTVWNMGDTRSGALFNPFVNIADAGSYRHALNSVASDVALSRASSRGHENYAFLNRLMSCPYFIDGGTRLAEGECVWGRIVGTRADRSTTREDVGYRSEQMTYQLGAQKEIAPDWFLGGSVGYSRTDTTSTGRYVETTSDSVQAGVTLKRQAGPWQFAAALLGGYESSTHRRHTPGLTGRATSAPDAYFIGARARISYEQPLGMWYVKPYADLDVTYDRASGYRETGGGLFNLSVAATERVSFMATQSVEIGGRIDVNEMTLRPYLALGVSFLSNADARARISLTEFQVAPFSVTTNLPRTYGNVTAGLELLTKSGWELRAEYGLRGAADHLTQSATLRAAMRF